MAIATKDIITFDVNSNNTFETIRSRCSSKDYKALVGEVVEYTLIAVSSEGTMKNSSNNSFDYCGVNILYQGILINGPSKPWDKIKIESTELDKNSESFTIFAGYTEDSNLVQILGIINNKDLNKSILEDGSILISYLTPFRDFLKEYKLKFETMK